MRKNKTKGNKVKKIVDNHKKITLVSIDYQQLTEAIVKANIEIKKKEAEEEYLIKQEQKNELKRIMRQKDYPTNEKWYCKMYHNFCNFMALFWSVMTLKKKNVQSDIFTFIIIKTILYLILFITKWIFYLAFLVFFILFMIDLLISGGNFEMLPLFLSILLLVYARIFRVAQIEIDNIQDGDKLTTLLSVFISVIAAIVSILSLISK